MSGDKKCASIFTKIQKWLLSCLFCFAQQREKVQEPVLFSRTIIYPLRGFGLKGYSPDLRISSPAYASAIRTRFLLSRISNWLMVSERFRNAATCALARVTTPRNNGCLLFYCVLTATRTQMALTEESLLDSGREMNSGSGKLANHMAAQYLSHCPNIVLNWWFGERTVR
jgi:hypothetical protein